MSANAVNTNIDWIKKQIKTQEDLREQIRELKSKLSVYEQSVSIENKSQEVLQKILENSEVSTFCTYNENDSVRNIVISIPDIVIPENTKNPIYKYLLDQLNIDLNNSR